MRVHPRQVRRILEFESNDSQGSILEGFVLQIILMIESKDRGSAGQSDYGQLGVADFW